MVGSNVDDRITSFRKSKWKTFDPEFAQMIKDKYPSIWALGGNIKGNDQYRKLYPIMQRGGTANSDMEINALELREAWVARHYEDFRIAGVIAQIKWLAVGSRGEQYMKNLVRERMKAMDEVKHEVKLSEAQNYLEHFGVKGMRWGVRNSIRDVKESGGSSSSLSKITGQKLSGKDERHIAKTIQLSNNPKILSMAREKAKIGADKINNDPKYKDSWKKPGSPAHKRYLEQHAKNLEDSLNDAIAANWKKYNQGTVPSGKIKATVGVDSTTLEPYLDLSIPD